MIYLDHAASTPPFPEVVQGIADLLAQPLANPSGLHSAAQAASAILETAREDVAETVGADPSEVIFTSGATESNNLALKGSVWSRPDRPSQVVISAVEHRASLKVAQWLESEGYSVVLVGPDSNGVLDPAAVADQCGPHTAIVSVMLVNNETGVIQPVAEIAEAVRKMAPGALIHSDVAQAISTMDVNFTNLGVDLMSISGHKIGGTKGAGALICRAGVNLTPLIHGGGQEFGRRGGTPNVVGIFALGKALQICTERRRQFARLSEELSNRLATGLKVEHREVASGAQRVPHIRSYCFEGCLSEDLVMLLDRDGISVSAGSSCSSGAVEPSHVLAAMGLSHDLSRGSLRFSFGYQTTTDEVDRAVESINAAVKRSRGVDSA